MGLTVKNNGGFLLRSHGKMWSSSLGLQRVERAGVTPHHRRRKCGQLMAAEIVDGGCLSESHSAIIQTLKTIPPQSVIN